MKYIRRRLILALAVMASVAMIYGTSTEAAKKPTMVKQIVMKVGEQKLITVKSTNKKVVWKCTNSKLVKVARKGKYKAVIQAKKSGRTILRAKTGGSTLSCRVIVKEKGLQDWDTDISVKAGYDKSTSKKYAEINWNYNSAADGYYIYRMIKPDRQDIAKIELIKKIKGNKSTSYRDFGYQDVKSLETPAYYVAAYKKLKNGKLIFCETQKKVVSVD